MSSVTHNIPTIFIIFGATGDLMEKKVIPSLFHLHEEKKLPDHFRVLGVSHRAYDDTKFRTYITSVLKEKKIRVTKKKLEDFLHHFHFQKSAFQKLSDYNTLGKHIDEIEKEWGLCANKLYYLAVPPNFISNIVKNLSKSKLSQSCSKTMGWSRIMLEKPIGSNAKSAKEVERTLAHFSQEHIYRIDHYFGKEMVQGIMNFRFSNNLFEHQWNRNFIEKIEMSLLESVGVEERGAFYESVGALRDVGQNHLLEMLAMLTMDIPQEDTPTSMRASREALLKQLVRPTVSQVQSTTFRAQYEGYKEIDDVLKKSEVETYFHIKAHIDSPRWKGVPIYIESGKRMGQVKKQIVVTMKHASPCVCPPGQHMNNRIVFSLYPDEGIHVEFWAKKPGLDDVMEKRTLDFMLYQKKNSFQYVEEYAKLFYHAFCGDQTWFVSKNEVQALWRFIDPIVTGWQKNIVPLHTYTPDVADIQTEARTYLESDVSAMTKQIAIVGLGKMGSNLSRRLMDQGWDVIGYNRSDGVTKELEKDGLRGAYSLKEMTEKFTSKQRIIWLMVPAGKPVDDTLFGKDGLVPYLHKGDIVIDGGNSFYKDTVRRQKKLKKYSIAYLDCGVSGGPAGARHGACLMIGGDKKVFNKIEPLFQDMAQVDGYQFFPGIGAGHFVKMVHNGIEYGMMQAIAEGFAIMKKSSFSLDLTRITDVYNHGSVIESHLIAWLKDAFDIYGEDLKKISGKIDHNGEGDWTVKTAHEMGVYDKVIHEALKYRTYSQKNPSYIGKIVSSLRGQFGQHSVEE